MSTLALILIFIAAVCPRAVAAMAMTIITTSAQPPTAAVDQDTGTWAYIFGSAGRKVRPGNHSTANQAALPARTTPLSTGGSAVTASAQSPMNRMTAA